MDGRRNPPWGQVTELLLSSELKSMGKVQVRSQTRGVPGCQHLRFNHFSTPLVEEGFVSLKSQFYIHISLLPLY